MYFKLCFFGILAIGLQNVKANAVEEFKIAFLRSILDCSVDFPISTVDLQLLRQKLTPEDMNVKCLLACAYMKVGMMDKEGKLSVEGIKRMSDALFADQPELRRKSEEFTQSCIYVNDVEIIGNKKECERANMIYKCSNENASKFNVVS